MVDMDDRLLLAQLVTLAGLIGATIEYIEVVRRRTARRQLAAQRAALEEDGLRGLVRVFLADGTDGRLRPSPRRGDPA